MYQALFFFPSRAKEAKKQKVIIIIITPDLRLSHLKLKKQKCSQTFEILIASPDLLDWLALLTYLGWVYCWFSRLLWEVFIQVLWFSPLFKNQHFQISIRLLELLPLKLYLFIYLLRTYSSVLYSPCHVGSPCTSFAKSISPRVMLCGKMVPRAA